jgi:SpoVK/Ycf46/Vps4 family AAA+-type ATPase
MRVRKSGADKHYMFKDLRVYAGDRVIAGKFKPRKAFDKNEISYVSTELTFYNKLFDEDDWTANIRIRAVNVVNGKPADEICKREEKRTISKTENIITYHYGWGEERHGAYWQMGRYMWIAEINGEEVGTAEFFIMDHGRVTEKDNPYFEAVSLRTYESPRGDLPEDKRIYLKSFRREGTRFIMGELRFRNKIKENWLCELFFNIYDDTGQCIGISDVMPVISPEDGGSDDIYTLSAGCGTDDPGSWLADNYRLEVVFMDTVVGVLPFSVKERMVERLNDNEALLNEDVLNLYDTAADTPKKKEKKKKKNTQEEKPASEEKPTEEEKPAEVEKPRGEEKPKGEVTEKEDENDDDGEEESCIPERPIGELMSELNELIGLESIKQQIREYVDYVCFLQYREDMGFEDKDEIVLHSVFTGNPGTGKTTVVKLLGQIFHSMGLLSKGHVHTVSASDLVSEYIRQSPRKTREAIDKARGGVLFIDEAYMMFKEGASGDFGTEAVAELMTEMSDGKGDIAIMVAGYPDEMEKLLNSNPGLRSRFKHYFHFDDYTPDELLSIARYAAEKKGVEISGKATERLQKLITEAYRKRDRSFGNGRMVNALIDEAKLNLGIRIVKNYEHGQLDRKLLSVIEANDIEDISKISAAKKTELEIDNELLKTALAELNELTGLENIKQEVNELVRLAYYYKDINRDLLKAFSMHSVFTGNPGTGKTTVARIMGRIYKALGLLERGHFTEADGSSLVAGYLGQTALKTKDLIEKAMGGVLFIDEAYSITDGEHNDFGKQAVASLIKEMEDKRGNFSLIVAGYTKNMERFLQSNPGLDSRFDNKFVFDDFREAELWVILKDMLGDRGLTPDIDAEKYLKKYIASLYTNRNQFFGNARSMRKIAEKTIRNQELRMASIERSERTPEMISLIILEDVREFEYRNTDTRPALGFRINS